MTQRQPTHSAPKPKKPRPNPESTDFVKGDLSRTRHGAPPTQEAAKPGERMSAQKQSDREHGYSQDSGYQTSGGYGDSEATGDGLRDGTEVSERSRTPFDADDEDERPETD